ncbi:hypothetical protein [Sutcliffiella horikoshii]|nr:hypothetical protein [Sutcliffiella horikoshii]
MTRNQKERGPHHQYPNGKIAFGLKVNEVTLLIGVEGAQTPAGGRDR